MRCLLKATIPTEVGNNLIRTGKLGKLIHGILTVQKPETAYFTEMAGERTAFVVLDIPEPSKIPAAAEPWFLLGATVEIHPLMTPQDLMAADPDFEKSVRLAAGE